MGTFQLNLFLYVSFILTFTILTSTHFITSPNMIENMVQQNHTISNGTQPLNSNPYKIVQPQFRNGFPEPYFCGQVVGSHYMFGSATTYCGGFSVTGCSTICFFRNYTFFQCEGYVCHCFS